MTKTRTKKIIQEKTPQERAKEGYSYEKACNAAKNSGTPTYRFSVGDMVQVGHLPNCVVEEVMDDGAMYLIRVTTKNNVEYSCSGFIGDDLEKNGILNYICDYIEK